MPSLSLADFPLWFLRGFVVAFGLLWGSFLNVVIYRVPRGMSVVRPPSHCPGCGKPIAPYDNIPVLSYLVLRGRARCCGVRMSPRYPLVELIGGALSLAVFERMVLQQPYALVLPLGRMAAIYASDFAVSLALVAAAFIDAEYMFLPDSITLGGALVGFGTASLRGLSLFDSVLGAAIGFGVLWTVDVVYKLIRGRTGMGMGDAKLLLLTGAWLGWTGVLFTLLLGSIQGVFGSILITLARGKLDEPEAVLAERRELRRLADEGDEEARQELEEDPLGDEPRQGFFQSRLPFGPYLILGFLEMLFAGDAVIAGFYAFSNFLFGLGTRLVALLTGLLVAVLIALLARRRRTR
jgi:leader peptidase (prepilin peptidase)/N-methyltransferase